MIALECLMKLSVRAMSITGASLWGGCMLLTGLANLKMPGYGENFLRLMASVYPGYRASPRMKNVLVGAAYGAVDGASAGALIALIYNQFAPNSRRG